MPARVCPLSNKQGKRIHIQPVHSVMINNTTKEDYSGNFQRLLEIQVIPLYSNHESLAKASTFEEPGAIIPHVGICPGAVGQLAVLP